MRSALVTLAVLGALAIQATTAAQADPVPIVGPVACDRTCLQGMVDQYLSAVTAHDPKRLPLAPEVRYTENGQALALGDGFWATASEVGKYKHYFLDPRTQQAGFFGVLKEYGSDVVLALRLKVQGRRISEIETVIARGGMGSVLPPVAANLEGMGHPDEIWLQDTPAGDRAGREDLVRIANMYFTAMENNDGKGDYSFFADGCYRLENGIQTTAGPHQFAPMVMPSGRPRPSGPNVMTMSCRAQFETGILRIVTRIRDRRFPIVDEDKGVAMAFIFFDHSGTVHDYKLADGTIAPGSINAPFTWEIAEAFKVDKGKITTVEAVLNNVPYGSKAGWEGK